MHGPMHHISAVGILAASTEQLADAQRHLQRLKPGNFWHGDTLGYPAFIAMQGLRPSLTLLERVSRELDVAWP